MIHALWSTLHLANGSMVPKLRHGGAAVRGRDMPAAHTPHSEFSDTGVRTSPGLRGSAREGVPRHPRLFEQHRICHIRLPRLEKLLKLHKIHGYRWKTLEPQRRVREVVDTSRWGGRR